MPYHTLHCLYHRFARPTKHWTTECRPNTPPYLADAFGKRFGRQSDSAVGYMTITSRDGYNSELGENGGKGQHSLQAAWLPRTLMRGPSANTTDKSRYFIIRVRSIVLCSHRVGEV